MSFKRTPNQVCETLKGGITDFPGAEIMSVFYETTPEAVAEILPPGLKPYESPLVIAGFNNFSETNFEVPYREAALYVSAVHQKTGRPGLLVPGMTLDVDMGSILGREAGGYPKKWGHLELKQDGSHYEASAARHGIALDGAHTPEDEYTVDPEEYLPYAFYGFDHKL